ncbi:hypothetical protein EVG20_g2165 [Dentipellis fragilis]|uniref:Uncharacterized protein n=1 Tax=Dentipellis fragilis TaxID=205917 RepID=A0A4Y9Z9M1_9AGAM|nr:hypothetical protein EVG20_g2165 [Dentipellis fragilis]
MTLKLSQHEQVDLKSMPLTRQGGGTDAARRVLMRSPDLQRPVSLLAYFGRRRLTPAWYILLEFPGPPFFPPMYTLKHSNPTIAMNHYPLLILLLIQLFWTLASVPLVAGASSALVNVSSVESGRALVFAPSSERLVPGKPHPGPTHPYTFSIYLYLSAISLFIYLTYYNISTQKALRSTTSRLRTLAQSHASLQAAARRHAYRARILFAHSTKRAAANKILQAENTGYLDRISALLVDKAALSSQICALQTKMGEQTRRALDSSAAFLRQIAILDGQAMDAAVREEALQARIQALEQSTRKDRADKYQVESERDDLRARFEALERAFRLEQDDNKRLKAENVQLKTDADKGNGTIQELTSTVAGLKFTICGLEAMCATQRRDIEDLKASKVAAVAELIVKDATITEHQQRLYQRDAEVVQLTQSKDTLAQQFTSLKAQLINARSDFVSIACSLSRTVKASSADRTTMADQRKDIRDLEMRVVDLEDFTLRCLLNIEHAKDQASAFLEQEESLKRELAAKDVLLADRDCQLEEVRSQLRDSIASRTALEDHLASKVRLFSDREGELCDARKRTSELELAHDAAHGDSTRTALLLAKCHSKLDRALSDNSQLKISEARIAHSHAEATSKLERAEAEIQHFVSQFAAKDALISDQQEQLEHARWEITDSQAAVGSLEAQVSAANVLIDERRAQVDALEGRTAELEDLLFDSMFRLEEAKDKIFELGDSEAELRCKAAALEVRLAQCADEPRDTPARGEGFEELLAVKENEHKAAVSELNATIEVLQDQKKAIESKANDQSELLEETMMELMQCSEEVKACREREEALQGKFEEQDELLEETMMRLLQRDEEAEERCGREAVLGEKVGELESLLQAQNDARRKLKKETEAKIVAAKCKEFELKACKKKCDELKMQVALQRTAIAMGEEESKEQAKELKKLRVELVMVKMQRDAGILELEEAEEQEVAGMLSMTEEGDSMEAVDGEGDSMEHGEDQFSVPPVEPPQVFTPLRTIPFSPKRPSPLNPLLLTPPPTPPAFDEYPQMRDVSILRAGVLVRQALRSCNAPVPKGDPEYDLVKPAVEELPLARLPLQRTDEICPWTLASMPAIVPRGWGSSSSDLLESPWEPKIPSSSSF